MQDFITRLRDELSGANLWINLLDIILIAVLLYLVFSFLIKRNSQRIIVFVSLGVLLSAVLNSSFLDLKMTGFLASQIIVILIIVVAILFTPEIKRGIWKVTSPRVSHDVFSTQYDCTDDELRDAIDDIVRAAQNMSKNNVGALMVIAPTTVPESVLESGVKLESLLSSPLLESIFNTKAPLHDGAVFIRGNKIIAAGCFLPLTQNTDLDQELGTRHRAAIGITETNNVISIIVSEETGVISVANDGKLVRYYDTDMLKDTLQQIYGLKATTMEKGKKKRRRI